MNDHPTVGWIGLGAMGLPMASVAAGVGISVIAYDIAPGQIAKAVDAGARAGMSAADVASQCDVLAVMVATPEQLHAVLFGPDGAAGALRRDTVVVVFATVGPEALEEVTTRLGGQGVAVVDAPCSGGVGRAASGELMLMVSGHPTPRSRVSPLLNAVGRDIFTFGDEPGDAQRVKLVNQLLCGVHIAVAGEAIAFAEALGLDAKQSFEAVRAGAAASFMLSDRGERMIAPVEEVRSAVSIFVKDLNLVTHAARDIEFDAVLAERALRQFRAGADAGMGSRDDSAVVEVYRQRLA